MVKTLTVLSVDPEFRGLCRELTEEENADLRQSIIDEQGCHDPIIYWENSPDQPNPILDGHHRYEHCTAEGLPYPIRGMVFPDRTAAKIWMLRNQLGRRNLTESERRLSRGRLQNLFKSDRTANLIPGGTQKSQNATSSQTREKQQKTDTASQIAEADGVDRSTVFRDAKLAKAADAVIEKAPDLKAPIEKGTIPLSAVPKLAAATDAILKRLEAKADDPEALRAATKKLTTTAPRNNGKPSKGLSFDKVEKHFGAGLRLMDDLNRSHPHANLHRMGLAKGKELMGLLAQWKKAVQ